MTTGGQNHTERLKLELGTHPANNRLNIIKPILFGRHVTVLPECEGGHVSIKDKEVAHRLVACWNACAGIPTEQLESELVKALAESARKYMKAVHVATTESELNHYEDQLKAAIAKAKPVAEAA